MSFIPTSKLSDISNLTQEKRNQTPRYRTNINSLHKQAKMRIQIEHPSNLYLNVIKFEFSNKNTTNEIAFIRHPFKPVFSYFSIQDPITGWNIQRTGGKVVYGGHKNIRDSGKKLTNCGVIHQDLPRSLGPKSTSPAR